MTRRLLTALTLLAAAAACHAQTPAAAEVAESNDIISAINAPGSSVRVAMPKALAARFAFGSETPLEEAGENQRHASSRQVGYRVQVYSDNNPLAAKGNAEIRKRAIEQRIPEMRAYLKYAPPYWRVQAGDFRTEGEAKAALQQLRDAFPDYANDMKVIKERINFTN